MLNARARFVPDAEFVPGAEPVPGAESVPPVPPAPMGADATLPWSTRYGDQGRDPGSEPGADGTPAPSHGRAWRVLIIDDEEDAQVVATALLRSVDRRIQTEWVADAAGGLERLMAGGYDACLVDLALGRDDGLDLIRRAISAGTDIPLIALTGRLGPEHSRATIAAGATDHLDKGELTARDLERSIRLGIARASATTRLRESEELYRSVVTSMAEGIVVQAVDGTITASNAAAERILGLTRDELAERSSPSPGWRAVREDGTPFDGMDHPAMTTLRTGEAQHGVLMGVHTGQGGLRWLTVNTEPVWRPGHDGPSAVVTSFTDVTAQRELEEQLREVARMEAVGRLAGGIAHDFNNLLTAITGYGELLITDLSLSEASREHVEQIRRAASRAASLTRQLLAFSRRQLLRPEVIVADDVVAGIESFVRRLIPASIQLLVRPGADGVMIRVDRAQVEQVIMNLATNARDAMPDGGTITIETGVTTLDARHHPDGTAIRPGAYLQITVTDDGQGMDETTRQRVFEPFFTTKEQGLGTGLGLAGVYGTVKQSDGHVWVYSEVGLGTAVKVYLPLAEGPSVDETAALAPTGAWVARENEVILLAEDEASVRGLVTSVLERAGYAVLVAVDGPSALGLARSIEAPISCLVSDVIMPGLRGPDVVRLLRASRPDLPVVLMSGFTEDTSDLHRSLADRVAFIQKPFATDELLRAVRTTIDGDPPGS